jgi:hypothetical protein
MRFTVHPKALCTQLNMFCIGIFLIAEYCEEASSSYTLVKILTYMFQGQKLFYLTKYDMS